MRGRSDLIGSIKNNYEREALEATEEGKKLLEAERQQEEAHTHDHANGHAHSHSAMRAPSPVFGAGGRLLTPADKGLRHESEGWKSLVTSLKSLEAIVRACGESCAFLPAPGSEPVSTTTTSGAEGAGAGEPVAVDDVCDEVLEVNYRGLSHENRFVREICYTIIETVVMAAANVNSTATLER